MLARYDLALLARCAGFAALFVACAASSPAPSKPAPPPVAASAAPPPSHAALPAGTSVLAIDQDEVTGIAVDRDRLYWLANGSVLAMPKGPGTRPTVLAEDVGPFDRGSAVAVDDVAVYFARAGAVFRVPKTGGKATPLASDASILPHSIAVDRSRVYWTNAPPGVPGAVLSVAKTGGATTSHASALVNPYGVFVDDGGMYFSIVGSSPDFREGAVLAIGAGHSSPTSLASLAGKLPIAVAADDGYVYAVGHGITGKSDGSVERIAKKGGTVTILASGLDAPNDIAIDEKYVYFTCFGDFQGGTGKVMKVAKEGGAPITIADKQDRPSSIAVDDTYVYWTNPMQDLVMGAPK